MSKTPVCSVLHVSGRKSQGGGWQSRQEMQLIRAAGGSGAVDGTGGREGNRDLPR